MIKFTEIKFTFYYSFQCSVLSSVLMANKFTFLLEFGQFNKKRLLKVDNTTSSLELKQLAATKCNINPATVTLEYFDKKHLKHGLR